MFRFLSINKKLLVAFLLLIAVFVLLSPELKQNPRYYLFERPFISTINLIQSVFRVVFNGIGATWHGYVYLVDVQEENQRLAEEVKQLQAEAVQLREKAQAGERLAQLLKVKETLDIEYAVAGIIAKDTTNWYNVVVINKGEKDGITPNMGVITSDGVAGRIVKTAPHYSRVLLLSDRNSAIAGLIQRTREEGIVAGRSGRVLQLNYIMTDSDIREGDLVLTSGSDGIFPGGIVIGTVGMVKRPERGLFSSVEVRPAVELSRIREVMVIKSPLSREIERLLREGNE